MEKSYPEELLCDSNRGHLDRVGDARIYLHHVTMPSTQY